MSVPDPTRVKSGQIICANGMPAFYTRPAEDVDFPCVILMHERYGLVAHTRDLATRCAREGFFVLAPNFFFRHPDQPLLNKGDSRCDLSDPDALDFLKAAIAILPTLDGADTTKVAVAGYCQTGRHPLVLASEVDVSAIIVWYGAASKREWGVTERQPKPLEELIARLNCPLFAAFGAEDHIIAIDDVRRLRNALEEHGKSYEMHLYEGAPHGWLNDTMPGRYRMAQAVAGWTAQQEFLRNVFSGAWPKDRVVWRFEGESRANYDFTKNVRKE